MFHWMKPVLILRLRLDGYFMKTILYIFIACVSVIFVTGMSRLDKEHSESGNSIDNSKTEKQLHKHTVKPHADIDINYVMPYPIELNKVVNLPITVRNGQDAEDVKVHITFDEGLSSADNMMQFSFGPQAAGARNNFDINFLVKEEGRAFINLFASMMIDGKYQTRSFAIAVIVGDIEKNKVLPTEKGVLQETPQGEQVISMPAKESSH